MTDLELVLFLLAFIGLLWLYVIVDIRRVRR